MLSLQQPDSPVEIKGEWFLRQVIR